MRITEDLLLGKKILYKGHLYLTLNPNKLQPVICDQSRHTLVQFPNGESSPWRLGNRIPIPKEPLEPAKLSHRVYNKDELDFIVQYDNLGSLSIDLLNDLATKHDRCSFVVEDSDFIDLFSQLPVFAGNYVHNTYMYNLENNLRNLPQNYICMISFYKMSTFLYDIYDTKQTGVGIAFEILDKQRSFQLPAPGIGTYMLFTNEYEGVFYLDGQVRLHLSPIDFYERHQYYEKMMSYCSNTPKQKKKRREDGGGLSWTGRGPSKSNSVDMSRGKYKFRNHYNEEADIEYVNFAEPLKDGPRLAKSPGKVFKKKKLRGQAKSIHDEIVAESFSESEYDQEARYNYNKYRRARLSGEKLNEPFVDEYLNTVELQNKEEAIAAKFVDPITKADVGIIKEAVGIDLSESAVEKAKESIRIKFETGPTGSTVTSTSTFYGGYTGTY